MKEADLTKVRETVQRFALSSLYTVCSLLPGISDDPGCLRHEAASFILFFFLLRH